MADDNDRRGGRRGALLRDWQDGVPLAGGVTAAAERALATPCGVRRSEGVVHWRTTLALALAPDFAAVGILMAGGCRGSIQSQCYMPCGGSRRVPRANSRATWLYFRSDPTSPAAASHRLAIERRLATLSLWMHS